MAGTWAEEAACAEECATELLLLGGAHTAGILLDMENFYDNCSLEMLLAAGLAMEFPKHVVVRGIEAALGNRAVTMGRIALPVGIAGTGLLAGDPAATSFARALLLPLCYKVWHLGLPKQVVLRTFVDDMRIRAHCDTTEEAARNAAAVAIPLIAGLGVMKNKVSSTKSLIPGPPLRCDSC